MLGLGGFRSSPRTRNLIIWIFIKFIQTWFYNVGFLLYPRSFRITWLNEWIRYVSIFFYLSILTQVIALRPCMNTQCTVTKGQSICNDYTSPLIVIDPFICLLKALHRHQKRPFKYPSLLLNTPGSITITTSKKGIPLSTFKCHFISDIPLLSLFYHLRVSYYLSHCSKNNSSFV